MVKDLAKREQTVVPLKELAEQNQKLKKNKRAPYPIRTNKLFRHRKEKNYPNKSWPKKSKDMHFALFHQRKARFCMQKTRFMLKVRSRGSLQRYVELCWSLFGSSSKPKL